MTSKIESRLRWALSRQEENALKVVRTALEKELEDWLGRSLSDIGHSPAIRLVLTHAVMDTMAGYRGKPQVIGQVISSFRARPGMGNFRKRDLVFLERYKR